MSQAMTLDDFRTLAETWGGDIARWPEPLRAQAEMLARTDAAQVILAEAQQLDRLIAGATPDISDARVSRAIGRVATTLAVEPARSRPAFAPLLHWLVPAGSFACAAIVGALLAVMNPGTGQGPAEQGTILSLLLDSALLDHNWVTR